MSKKASPVVIDSAGLHEIATTKSNNLKSLYEAKLKDGSIAVPSCVWAEFELLYEDEAESIAPHIGVKINLKRAYYAGAASIADKLGARFSSALTPYNSQSDLYTAAIAIKEGYSVLTTTAQLDGYIGKGCECIDLGSWAETQSTSKQPA